MLSDELRDEVRAKFREHWTVRPGRVVPDENSVSLGNDGVKINAAILYADLSDSTKLVDNYRDTFAASIYGTFLRCASKIIKANNGTITAFDGDRVMAVYMGDSKEADACWTALKINQAMIQIIRPIMREYYPTGTYTPHHTVGIDVSDVLVVKDGVRGDNDMIWVGRAANYAAKLCTLDHNWQTRITQPVFNKLGGGLLITRQNTPVWEQRTWTDMNNMTIYRSSCLSVSID